MKTEQCIKTRSVQSVLFVNRVVRPVGGFIQEIFRDASHLNLKFWITVANSYLY